MTYITRIPENEVTRKKIKSRNAYEKYWNLKFPCKYSDIVSNLSKREKVFNLKQEKESEVIIRILIKVLINVFRYFQQNNVKR